MNKLATEGSGIGDDAGAIGSRSVAAVPGVGEGASVAEGSNLAERALLVDGTEVHSVNVSARARDLFD